jgi:hypothetical protein
VRAALYFAVFLVLCFAGARCAASQRWLAGGVACGEEEERSALAEGARSVSVVVGVLRALDGRCCCGDAAAWPVAARLGAAAAASRRALARQ